MPTITDHAIATPDKPAFIMGSTGETVTFAELDARANQVAQLLILIFLVHTKDGVAVLLHCGLQHKTAIDTFILLDLTIKDLKESLIIYTQIPLITRKPLILQRFLAIG